MNNSRAKSDVQEAVQNDTLVIAPIEYRQFDTKYCVYTGKTNGIVAWPRYRSLSHLLHPQNISLIVPRQTSQDWHHAFVSSMITDMNILASAKLLGAGVQFPLYATGAAGRICSDDIRGTQAGSVRFQSRPPSKALQHQGFFRKDRSRTCSAEVPARRRNLPHQSILRPPSRTRALLE